MDRNVTYETVCASRLTGKLINRANYQRESIDKYQQKAQRCGWAVMLERGTRFELATLTLATSRSTN